MTARGPVGPRAKGAIDELPNTAHTSRRWGIREIAPDFRLEDVWELPGRDGPHDFPHVVELAASLDPAQGSTRYP